MVISCLVPVYHGSRRPAVLFVQLGQDWYLTLICLLLLRLMRYLVVYLYQRCQKRCLNFYMLRFILILNFPCECVS